MTDYGWDERAWRSVSRTPRLPRWYDPAGVWDFDGSLAESRGNGVDFASYSGTPRYFYLGGSQRVLYLRSSIIRVQSAALQITGDVTIALIAQIHNYDATNPRYLYCHGDASTDTEALNILYSTALRPQGTRWLTEHGSGTDDSYDTPYLPPLRRWGLLVSRRQSNVAQHWWDGAALGAASGAITPPTGGASGYLSLGGLIGYVTAYPEMSVAGFAVYPTALSEVQIVNLAASVAGAYV